MQDPFDQDDWDAYKHFMSEALRQSRTFLPSTFQQLCSSVACCKLEKQVGPRVQIVGDDLLVTNPTRVKKARSSSYVALLVLTKSLSRPWKLELAMRFS